MLRSGFHIKRKIQGAGWQRYAPDRGLVIGVSMLVGILGVGALWSGGLTSADTPAPTPCQSLLVQQHTVDGHMVGETDCQITNTQTVQNNQGQNFKEVDVALSGSAFGYADPNTKGNTRKDLTDAPNILFPQFGITSWEPGVGTYTGTATSTDAGAGLTVLYPDPTSGTPWNGKAFVLVHGQSNDTPIGPIIPQQQGAGFTNDTFANLYADEMINKGYAVIYTRRPASSGVPTTLDDGTKLDESLNDNLDTLLSFTQTGEKLLQQQLGKAPTAVYWYGHSAGVIAGRLLNYSGMNYNPVTGKPFFNGFLDDDPGGGLPLPLSMQEGTVLGEQGNMATFNPSDELFQTSSSRSKFTKEITLAHEMYQSYHTWLPEVSYLNLKREGAQLYQQEGLSDATRTYEVDGVSHIANTPTSPANTLDIGGVADAAIDLLDNWVQKNVAPPATIANLGALSQTAPVTSTSVPAPNPGANNNYAAASTSPASSSNHRQQPTAIELPPIACPTGVRYASPGPDGGPTETGYTPFDGTTLEPVNAGGALVDVNGNGYRDTMPTMQQAWQMLGLLGKNQTLNKQVYVACVTQSANSLQQQGLLSKGAATWYIQQSQNYPNLPW